jgi:DeoR family fructose operon transcriptional repressor
MLALVGLSFIGEDQTVFIDTGAAPLRLATMLPCGLRLRVVTNSLPVATALASRRDVSLFVVGGSFNPTACGFVDASATVDIRRFSIDLCFLGEVSLRPTLGVFGFEPDDASFKNALLNTAVASALMVPKFDHRCSGGSSDSTSFGPHDVHT